jgi:hypothetical protein
LLNRVSNLGQVHPPALRDKDPELDCHTRCSYALAKMNVTQGYYNLSPSGNTARRDTEAVYAVICDKVATIQR